MSARAIVPPFTEEDDLLLFLENTIRRVRALDVPLSDAAAALRAGARAIDIARRNPSLDESDLAQAVLANLRAEMRLARAP